MRAAALALLPLVLALGGAAAAEDGPARTVGRLAEPPPRREVILLVGGYGTSATDGTWRALEARFAGDARFRLVRFGATPGRPYDTTGPLEASARTLIDEVRAHGGAPVHLVAHSMGGAVVDRALALGLGSDDGVRSYVALASPHGGATLARIAQGTLARAGDGRETARELVAVFGGDPDTPAARDLAVPREPPPAADAVARLQLRSATDLVVLHGDARAPPGIDRRTLLPARFADAEGHGAILRDPRALELIAATVTTGVAPADGRGAALRAATDAVSRAASALAALGLAAAGLVAATAAHVAAPLRRRRASPLAA